MAGFLEEDDALMQNVDEEIAAKPQLLIHIIKAVIDEADRCPKPLAFGELDKQLILGPGPEFHNVGQILMIDHDQQIKIGEIAADRILDPVPPSIASKQDDLQKLAIAKPRLGSVRDAFCKPVADDLDDMGKLALLGFRQMIKIGAHLGLDPSEPPQEYANNRQSFSGYTTPNNLYPSNQDDGRFTSLVSLSIAIPLPVRSAVPSPKMSPERIAGPR